MTLRRKPIVHLQVFTSSRIIHFHLGILISVYQSIMSIDTLWRRRLKMCLLSRYSLRSSAGRVLPGAKYSYDVRDAARHIEKRLTAYATKAGYSQLKPWVQYLKNHFWSCAKAANGSAELFRVS